MTRPNGASGRALTGALLHPLPERAAAMRGIGFTVAVTEYCRETGRLREPVPE